MEFFLLPLPTSSTALLSEVTLTEQDVSKSPFHGVGGLRCYHQPGISLCPRMEEGPTLAGPCRKSPNQVTAWPHSEKFFSHTEHSLHPRLSLIETQKKKCQAIEFKQKGFRQFISHFSNFAVYICKPHLFTCPVFVKVNSFGATT